MEGPFRGGEVRRHPSSRGCPCARSRGWCRKGYGADRAFAADEAAAFPLTGTQAARRPAGVAGDLVRVAHRDRLGASAARARLWLRHDRLAEASRLAAGRSVGGAGSKHHLLLDGGGIPLAWTVTGGNGNDVTQLLEPLDRVPHVRGRVGRPRRRPRTPPTAATTSTKLSSHSPAASSAGSSWRTHRARTATSVADLRNAGRLKLRTNSRASALDVEAGVLIVAHQSARDCDRLWLS